MKVVPVHVANQESCGMCEKGVYVASHFVIFCFQDILYCFTPKKIKWYTLFLEYRDDVDFYPHIHSIIALFGYFYFLHFSCYSKPVQKLIDLRSPFLCKIYVSPLLISPVHFLIRHWRCKFCFENLYFQLIKKKVNI